MSSRAPLIEAAVAVLGVLAVHAIGGGRTLVAVVATVAVGVLLLLWRRRLAAGRPAARRDLWTLVRAMLAVVVVWHLVSFSVYVGTDNGDTFSQRVATWGRDHRMGRAIDLLEARVYSTPPSKTPAEQLALELPVVAPTTTSPPATTTTTTVAVAAPETTTTTTLPPPPPPPQPPAPLTPHFSPALDGEGEWAPVATAAGHEVMWATSIRPLPEAGGAVASMVVIDQTDLRVGLFNGAEQPGGSWQRGSRVRAELQPALVAAMNGGFRFEHMKGGYKTEGVEVKPLRDGDATLAVGIDGRLVLGELGRDLVDDGSWVSLRQNLVLIVDGGESQVQRGIREGVWWGADYGREVYVPRSAVCALADGRLAYLMVGKVDATQLAEALINVGCQRAIQLDINGTWPVFFTFPPGPDGAPDPQFLDRRMGGNRSRYLTGSTKEFFAFFDVTLVPPGSVLDA